MKCSRNLLLFLAFLLLLLPAHSQEDVVAIKNGVKVKIPALPYDNFRLNGPTSGQCLISGPLGLVKGGPCGITQPFNPRGTWAAATTYAVNDLFSYQGGSYLVTAAFTSTSSFDPSSTLQIAAPGSQGAAGAGGTNGVSSLAQLASVRSKEPISVNLLNSAAVVTGSIDGYNGTLNSADTTYRAMDFVPCNSGGQMVANFAIPGYLGSHQGLAFYDQNFVFLSGDFTAYTAGTPFTCPSAAAFVRTGYNVGYGADTITSTAMLVNGAVLPSSYQAFLADGAYVQGLKSSIGTVPSDGLTRIVQTIISQGQPAQRNLLDPTRVQANSSYSSLTQTIRGGVSYFFSDYIPVIPGATYTFAAQSPCVNSGCNTVEYGAVYYDLNQQLIPSSYWQIASIVYGSTFVPPSGAAYIRVPLVSLAGAMIVQGTTIPNPFVPFAQTPLTLQQTSLWNGKKMAIMGDSYCGYNAFQQQIAAAHGMTIKFQDCRPGRPIGSPNLTGAQGSGIFECYSGSATGTNLGATYSPAGGGWGTCAANNNGTQGNTLAQDLAGVDVLLVELGTNDNYDGAVGTIADTAGTQSTYGYMQTAIQGLLSIVPATLRVVWMTPVQVCNTATPNRAAAMPPVTQAILDVAKQWGVPVINNLANSGFNLYSDTTLLQSDCVHPTVPQGFNVFARYPIQQLYQIPPMD